RIERQSTRDERDFFDRFVRPPLQRDYHEAEAAAAERARQPFAAVFHLDQLLRLRPAADRFALLKRRAAALARAGGGPWAARALARQAVAPRPGLRARPLPLLAGLAVPTPDPRLTPHDRQTREGLRSLRAEAEAQVPPAGM